MMDIFEATIAVSGLLLFALFRRYLYAETVFVHDFSLSKHKTLIIL